MKMQEKAGERKLRWDEENRLLSSDDNGFVTNYWYDADGERTVKTSGEGEQVYVNSEFAGGRTNTAKFSLYVSPYLVANQGGRYTKHIYIGSQRIVSKLGDLDSYGSDPRRVPYAGSEADAVSIDYKTKYASQQQVIKDNYAAFDVPYHGEDNNDYVDGEGFCCNDGSVEAAQARALARAKASNFQDADAYEKMQFYYHPDHLGSSSYITDLDGEVVQHIEYVPFGEVFIEERNNVWNTPYLFNAKEFDEETGMYYYGARYYEPRLAIWISVDPISNFDPTNDENYIDGEHNLGVYNNFNLNPYGYCYLNPVKLVDPNGKQVDAVDFVPVWGSCRDIYRGFRDGDIFTGVIGVGGLVADIATLGAGSVITGPIKAGVKTGVKATVKATVKTTVKSEVKVSAKSAATQATKRLTNEQIVMKAADKANKAIPGIGHVAGTKKHTYAENLIERYQKIYGDRGLKTNEYFNNGPGNRGFLDVHDIQNKIIYDFKFGKNPKMGQPQIDKYMRNFPNNQVVPIKKPVNP